MARHISIFDLEVWHTGKVVNTVKENNYDNRRKSNDISGL